MGTPSLTVPSLSRANTKARKLARVFGVRWAASWMAAVGIDISVARRVLLNSRH